MIDLMSEYDKIREQYRPDHIKVLMIAESQPPAAGIDSSRHFYRTDRVRTGDRLFTNTVKALYPAAADKTEAEIQVEKEHWLRHFQANGWYMIEALEQSQPHKTTKPERQELIQNNLPRLLERVKQLPLASDVKLILIKSNVFDVAAEPLRKAGYQVLNKQLLDYPGQYNQAAYRQKLAVLASNLVIDRQI